MPAVLPELEFQCDHLIPLSFGRGTVKLCVSWNKLESRKLIVYFSEKNNSSESQATLDIVSGSDSTGCELLAPSPADPGAPGLLSPLEITPAKPAVQLSLHSRTAGP